MSVLLLQERFGTAWPWLARSLVVLGALVVGGYFLKEGIDLSREHYDTISSDYEYKGVPRLPQSDFGTFYAGARSVRAGDRGDIYDLPGMVRRILIARGADPAQVPAQPNPHTDENRWQRYYNPPFFLIALSPLTFLEMQDAYLVAIALNVAALVGLAFAFGFILRWRQPATSLMALALFSFSPVYFALHHAQPTILLALLLSAGYLALRNGRHLLAGVLLATMSLKPHWLFPGLTALKAERRLIVPLLGATFALVVLPFALLGADAFVDYVKLVTGRGEDDLNTRDFAGSMLSWAGFFRALAGETRTDLWFAASLVTLAFFVLLWLRTGPEIGMAAGVLVVLLVAPHSHSQDWVLAAPVAAILLSLDWTPAARAGVVAGLAGIYLGANDWPAAQRRMDANGEAIFWVTLAAFALLVWLTAVTLIQQRRELPRAATDSNVPQTAVRT